MDVPTRVEEDKEPRDSNLTTLSDVESSDEEKDDYQNFDLEAAKTDVYEIPGCYKITLSDQLQKQLGVVVGVNVSEEFPWKRVQFRYFMDHVFDEIENGEKIQEFFINYKPDKKILIGYAPSLVEEDDVPMQHADPFVIYVTEKAAREAAAIIKNIEIYERMMLHNKLIKYPRKWESRGSEYEIGMDISSRSEVIDVEIQSVYPMKQSRNKFQMRTTADVRDGYAEIIPGDAKFQNVFRLTVTVGIQTTPATVTLEQQTDPTFPSNAWSQYFYEIKKEQDMLDLSSDEEQEKLKPTSKTATPTPDAIKEPKPPPELSNQVKYLLSILDFNQIDMYRNDYPQISEKSVPIFHNPYLKEIFCFANISKSKERYVSALDWYPHLTGLVLTSYAFGTKETNYKIGTEKKVDPIQRLILEPNAILMWSFTDSLNFKLEFESPREITALSFCPYDQNIVIGGTINGQIIIWDLQDRTQNLDAVEHLTVEEANNRALVSEFLSWTLMYNQGTLVVPSAISMLANSQTGAIIDIKWLSRHHYVALNGRIQENYLKSRKSRYFLTLSFDGSVAYWNLDFDVKNVAKAGAKRNLPSALTQNESVYKVLDNFIKPTYMVTYCESLTAIICDEANYKYNPQINDNWEDDTEGKNYPVIIEEAEKNVLKNSFIIGTILGRIEHLTFEGIDSGLEVNTENITTPIHSFARVHDGSIVALKKNPFYPEIFVSIGRTIMAIWKEDFPFTPILWRQRPKRLTAVQWSTERPAVLFLTRSDGNFEAWDLLEKDDDPCLIEVLGGGVITALSEHRPKVPNKVICIGDYNSSLRMVALPEGFYKPVPDELERLKTFVEKEVYRKQSIQNWQQNWYAKNADIVEAKKNSKAAAQKDLERLRRQEEEAKKLSQAKEDAKEPEARKSAAHYDVAEKLDRKFDEMNLKRLIRSLMSRMRVDPTKLQRETALEKEYINYEQRKKESVKAAIAKVSEDIAAIRARLLPVEKKELQLSEIIAESVKNILKVAPTYAEVELEAKTYFEESPPIPDISYETIIERAGERRILLNKALGIPYDRQHYYEQEKEAGRLSEWDFGDVEFMQNLEESRRRTKSPVISEASMSDILSQKESGLNLDA